MLVLGHERVCDLTFWRVPTETQLNRLALIMVGSGLAI
jgi:hypothetical protein